MSTEEQVDLIVNNLIQIGANVSGIAEDQQTLNDKITELQESIDAGNDVDLTEITELSNALVERTQILDAAFPVADEPVDPPADNGNLGDETANGEG